MVGGAGLTDETAKTKPGRDYSFITISSLGWGLCRQKHQVASETRWVRKTGQFDEEIAIATQKI